MVGGGSSGRFGASGAEIDAAMQAESGVPFKFLGEAEIGQLVRVLDRPLFRLAVRAMLLEQEPDLMIDLTDEERFLDEQGGIMVAIKLEELDAEISEYLGMMGLRIIASNQETNVIVGVSSDRSLVDIGLLDGVLRVVPTEMQDAPAK